MSLDKNETHGQVIAICARVLQRDESAISEKDSFEQLHADSLDKIEMIMRIEEALKIHIDDDKFEDLALISELVNYIHELRLS